MLVSLSEQLVDGLASLLSTNIDLCQLMTNSPRPLVKSV